MQETRANSTQNRATRNLSVFAVSTALCNNPPYAMIWNGPCHNNIIVIRRITKTAHIWTQGYVDIFVKNGESRRISAETLYRQKLESMLNILLLTVWVYLY